MIEIEYSVKKLPAAQQAIVLSGYEKQLRNAYKQNPVDELLDALFVVGTKKYLLGEKQQATDIYEFIIKESKVSFTRGKTYYQLALTNFGDEKKATSFFELSTAEYRKEEFPVYQLIAENIGHVAINYLKQKNEEKATETLQAFFNDEQLVLNSDAKTSLYYAALVVEMENKTPDSPGFDQLLSRELQEMSSVPELFRLQRAIWMNENKGKPGKLPDLIAILNKLFKTACDENVPSSVKIGLELQLAQLCLAMTKTDDERDHQLHECNETAKTLAQQIDRTPFSRRHMAGLTKYDAQTQLVVIEAIAYKLLKDKANFESSIEEIRSLASERKPYSPFVPAYYSSSVPRNLVNAWKAIVDGSELPDLSKIDAEVEERKLPEPGGDSGGDGGVVPPRPEL